MKRREFLKAAAAGGVCALSGSLLAKAASASAAPRGRRPNVLFIYADDLDFDEINTYEGHPDPSLHGLPSYTGAFHRGLEHLTPTGYTLGYEHALPMLTPHLDGLAREGAIFSRFYITSSICTPSRYSLLTGRYASRSKHLRSITPDGESPIVGFNTPLDDELALPHILQKNGYVTGHIGKWHNFGHYGDARVAEVRDGDPRDPEVARKISDKYAEAVNLLKKHAGFDYVAALYGGNIEGLGLPKALYEGHKHNLEWMTEGAVNFIDANHDKPFFLYVASTVPHGWMGDIGTDEDLVYTPSGILSEPPVSGMPSRASVYERVKKAGHGRPMATWFDDSVGVLLKKLDEHGIADNTVVFFASDHNNRGKQSVYEGCRAPFMVRWPGTLKPRTVSHAVAGNIDIAPTILDICGIRKPDEMVFDGVSMKPLLEGKAQTIRDALMLEVAASRAIVTEGWKYIANRPPDEIRRKMEEEAKTVKREDRTYGWDGSWIRRPWSQGQWVRPKGINYRTHAFIPDYFDYDQLYDMTNDMYEQNNLADDPQHEDVVEKMKARLSAELARTPQTFGEF